MLTRSGLLWGALLSAACAGTKNVRDVVGQAHALPGGARIAVADPLFYADLVEIESEEAERDLDEWRANAWVGRIWFAGGYEILPEEGNQVRSVEVELSDRGVMRAQVAEWLDQTVPAALAETGFVVAEPVGRVAVSRPEQRNIRGTTAFDGGDNVNLPRFDLRPGPAVSPGVETPADSIFVPIVVSYYAHNAGWFVGQEDGTWAGARFRLFWSLVSPDDGSVVGWGEIATNTKREALASPNRQQQQDLLLAVEADAAKRLGRQLAARRATPRPINR